jgi:heme/copper-type cytochrome/quinol oxidase subunit 4
MNLSSFKYSMKVWITGLFLSPFVYFLFNGLDHTNGLGALAREFTGFMVFSIVLGSVFSLPSYALLYFITILVNKSQRSALSKKAILLIVSIILTILPFYVFSLVNLNEGQHANLKLEGFYLATITASIFCYEMRAPDSK